VTYAESIERLIQHQRRELSAVLQELARCTDSPVDSSGWSPREILLHLIGATRQLPADLRNCARGGQATAPRLQPGGAYVDVPDLHTEQEAGAALLHVLDEIAEASSGLDDAILSTLVKVSGSSDVPNEAPVGLVVRHALTVHFDEHLAQLRVASGG
jgi:hypothetical protein